MACVNVIAADTDEEAQLLATSFYQLVLGLIRNNRKPLAPPSGDMDLLWSADERAAVNQMLYYSFVGSTDKLARELTSFIETTGVDEIMVATHMFDVNAKIRSLELTASLFKTNKIESFA
jgi:alkanesulfonate monooxygenase SsuD/methylene tetrahydromethanopterin reductase-like flavin-dependent oxidoreductase (luciferase family)